MFEAPAAITPSIQAPPRWPRTFIFNFFRKVPSPDFKPQLGPAFLATDPPKLLFEPQQSLLIDVDFATLQGQCASGGQVVNFAEQAPSDRWSFLKFKGVTIAEVWFKPEGEPSSLNFRIPRSVFDIPGIRPKLTMHTLFKAVAIAPSEIESWRYGESIQDALGDSDLTTSLPMPPDGSDHLVIHLRVKPVLQSIPNEIVQESALPPVKWQELEASWKTIVGLEVTVEATRKNVEAVRAELEAAMRMTLSTEDKTNALAADVAQWNKAKNRAHFAVPKANEFIHRATWAEGVPERKMLGELFKNPIEDPSSLPPIDEIQKSIEFLRKDRQVLGAQGVAVYQECKNLVSDVQSALRRLQSNAASRASQKKGGLGARRK